MLQVFSPHLTPSPTSHHWKESCVAGSMVSTARANRSGSPPTGLPKVLCCLENIVNSMKRQKDKTLKETPQFGRCPVCYWKRVEKYLQKE